MPPYSVVFGEGTGDQNLRETVFGRGPATEPGESRNQSGPLPREGEVGGGQELAAFGEGAWGGNGKVYDAVLASSG